MSDAATDREDPCPHVPAGTALAVLPAPTVLPAKLFAPTPMAAKRVLEFSGAPSIMKARFWRRW
jgi:hypothetical protein